MLFPTITAGSSFFCTWTTLERTGVTVLGLVYTSTLLESTAGWLVTTSIFVITLCFLFLLTGEAITSTLLDITGAFAMFTTLEAPPTTFTLLEGCDGLFDWTLTTVETCFDWWEGFFSDGVWVFVGLMVTGLLFSDGLTGFTSITLSVSGTLSFLTSVNEEDYYNYCRRLDK